MLFLDTLRFCCTKCTLAHSQADCVHFKNAEEEQVLSIIPEEKLKEYDHLSLDEQMGYRLINVIIDKDKNPKCLLRNQIRFVFACNNFEYNHRANSHINIRGAHPDASNVYLDTQTIISPVSKNTYEQEYNGPHKIQIKSNQSQISNNTYQSNGHGAAAQTSRGLSLVMLSQSAPSEPIINPKPVSLNHQQHDCGESNAIPSNESRSAPQILRGRSLILANPSNPINSIIFPYPPTDFDPTTISKSSTSKSRDDNSAGSSVFEDPSSEIEHRQTTRQEVSNYSNGTYNPKFVSNPVTANSSQNKGGSSYQGYENLQVKRLKVPAYLHGTFNPKSFFKKSIHINHRETNKRIKVYHKQEEAKNLKLESAIYAQHPDYVKRQTCHSNKMNGLDTQNRSHELLYHKRKITRGEIVRNGDFSPGALTHQPPNPSIGNLDVNEIPQVAQLGSGVNSVLPDSGHRTYPDPKSIGDEIIKGMAELDLVSSAHEGVEDDLSSDFMESF